MFRKKKIATFNLSPKAAEKMQTSSHKITVVRSSEPIVQLWRQHSMFLIFAVLLLAGIVVGALSAKNAGSGLLEQLDFLFASNYKARMDQPMGEIFVASMASSFLFILAIGLAGCSFWGIAAVPCLTFFRGFGLGLLSGFLYGNYGWQGFLFHLLVILPGMFISSLGIAFCAEKSMRLSFSLIAAQRQAAGPEKPDFRQYFFYLGKACILISIAAVLDLVCSACFSGLFHFE